MQGLALLALGMTKYIHEIVSEIMNFYLILLFTV